MLRKLNFCKEILRKVKNVVEKESVELSSALEDVFCGIVAGDGDDHPFDCDSPQSHLWCE